MERISKRTHIEGLNQLLTSLRNLMGDSCTYPSTSNTNTTTTTKDFVCEICTETKTTSESIFPINGCTHVYCTDCMVHYVTSKLEENTTNICCPEPGCEVSLNLEDCLLVLPQGVCDKWGDALCEAAIGGSQKFYCPFKDCSAMLVNDDIGGGGGGGGKGKVPDQIKEAECPYCFRLFCAQCRVPWHAEIGCKEFQKLHKDEREREDILLMKMAGNKNWRRCPSCRIYVERKEGCRYIKCSGSIKSISVELHSVMAAGVLRLTKKLITVQNAMPHGGNGDISAGMM
ncbi:hypothetical protein Tsubulata_005038 [Turnera subulata]|uniref:RBR-type E3 ubiquitin transferase n=1 Tax=Turnera subulata TaxID=218843 RepID=A0A9Q0FB86_9ROSI|nr:hypothetical protein Tsubulata_005038 [Turnera subulata]